MLTILSKNLKKLVLLRCEKLREANVDAPNLQTFEYTGDKTCSFSFTAPKLQEAKLYFESSRKGVSKTHIDGQSKNLQKFLLALNRSKSLKLVVRHKKVLIRWIILVFHWR